MNNVDAASQERHVDIRFDCLPLRSIGRWDIPLDASPRFRARCERIKSALHKHGAFNTYYLQNGVCRFHLSNQASEGVLEFTFDGTVTTDSRDEQAAAADLRVELRLADGTGRRLVSRGSQASRHARVQSIRRCGRPKPYPRATRARRDGVGASRRLRRHGHLVVGGLLLWARGKTR